MADPIPVFEVEFDKSGKVFSPAQVQDLLAALAAQVATDLIVFSHGWNNDMADARDLYRAFFQKLAAIREKLHRSQLESRTFAALAVLWPSKQFTEQDLIPSGDAASLDDEEMQLEKQLEDLKEDAVRLGVPALVGPQEQQAINRAKALVSKLEDDNEDAQREFVRAIRSTLSPAAAHAEDGSDEFFSRDPVDLLRSLSAPVVAPPPASQGGGALSLGDDTGTGAGQAAGISDLFSTIKAGARRLLNFTTYYKMKERAGLVGGTGVADVLREVRGHFPSIKLHLIGHSFGGRVVTSAVDALGPQVRVDTLILLQAAFSHNGLAAKFDGQNDGFFVKVVSDKKVKGGVAITHTKNDKAVGIAYPLASRVVGENAASVAAALGDANDPYGGIGRNGAQHTTVDKTEQFLRGLETRYSLNPQNIYNLNSDEFISNHSDIRGDQVAHMTLSAIEIS